MTKRHLMIFSAVYDQKSMTRAAETLFMTQPAVSQAIRELEEHYSVKLFERFSRRLYVTPAGEELYHFAKDILHLFDDVEERLGEEGLTVIRVGANLSAGTALLGHWIDQFCKSHPRTKVKVRVSGSKRLLRLLGENEIDFALLEDTVLSQDVTRIPFYRDRLVMVAAPNSPFAGRPLCFEELKETDFLLREPGAGVRDLFDYQMLLRNIHIDPLWESSSTTTLVEAAHAGYGVSIQPYLLVKKYLDSGYLAELSVTDLSLERNLNIVCHKNKILSRETEDLIHMIRAGE